MKTLFYPKLAYQGIKKNKQLYIPYILSCIGMVTIYYIFHFLSLSPLVSSLKSGANIALIMSLGKFVMAVFALLFLFYTNSFLVRRRYKEFGLYNILGMDKHSISKVVFFESLIVSVISIVSGVLLGIVFSKLCELGLINAIHTQVNYDLSIRFDAVLYTVLIFAFIFLLLMLKSIISVRKCKPLELLKSEKAGEKAPKANWFLAIIGVILLASAYYISVSIKSPLTAILLFFVAVVMVIVATYMLFMSGSVALCKILQKNKKYYYKKQHFVSVSSMAYRMKRNGAGLASICILATMVLVMISSTSSLYFGANDTLKSRYPQQCRIQVNTQGIDNLNNDNITSVNNVFQKVFSEYNCTPKNVAEFSFAMISGVVDNNKVIIDADNFEGISNYENLRMLYFYSEKEFNRLTNSNISLKNNEAYLYTDNCEYNEDNISFGELKLNVIKQSEKFPFSSYTGPTITFVVSDFSVLKPLDNMCDFSGDRVLQTWYYYGFDTDLEDEKTIDLMNSMSTAIEKNISMPFAVSSLPGDKEDFFTTFGGLFFLGIMLSVVFIFAAAMIIYYKQVSEGFEDKARFEIMQNVGMTKSDIKKSINSQVLTVFFAPLLFALLHLAFAFPLIWKLLQLFGLSNLTFTILITLAAFLIFAAFYAIIYKLTARAYYKIVSKTE